MHELEKLEKMGISVEKLKVYDVICLPETIFSFVSEDELFETPEIIELCKRMREASLHCCCLCDLGLGGPPVEHIGGDLQLGLVWVKDKLAIPIVASVIAGFIVYHCTKPEVIEGRYSKPQIHVTIRTLEDNRVSELSYRGDGETFLKILDAQKYKNGKREDE